MVDTILKVILGFLKLLGMAFLLGLSLLPLASLLLVVPAVQPDESVLSEASAGRRSRLQLGRRLFALVTGFVVLIALIAMATEIVSHLPLKIGYFSAFARSFLPDRLEKSLPPTMIDHWPEVMLIVYMTDLVLLFFIGKVPLGYNLRNMRVRWITTLLTGFAFTVVIGLLVVMLAFVNGVHGLTEASGDPSNVFILSDAATDEIFSNLGTGTEIDNIVRLSVKCDTDNSSLPRTVSVKKMWVDDDSVYMMSKETYTVLNMPIPNAAKGAAQRRFVQLRGIESVPVAAAVHNIELRTGRWFTEIGSREGVIESVIGEGLARTLGVDFNKPSLEVGDQFEMANRQFEIVGIMKSDKTTFGSELWAKWSTLKDLTLKDTYTTAVLRVDEESGRGAEAFAKYLEDEFRTPKVKAVPETKYYSDLAKSNKQFLYAIMLIAAVMAIGGIFGVMNTMFAAIAQRTKDIGVLRILGFKRWQILVSFMLESLGIALIGGVLGCALGSLADGFSSKSIMTAGMGGGKTVALKLTIDLDVILCGILFTFVMGRLGGLLPSLSAMRLAILDTLK